MAFPANVSRKLRQNMGEDAGGDLVTWLEEMRAEHETFRSEMRDGFAKLDKRLAEVDAGLRIAIAESKADLMKWMLVFWVGAVGAVAALAGVLRSL